MINKKEPSCINNHEKMRKYLEDNEFPPRNCPACNWQIRPRIRIESTSPTQSEGLAAIIRLVLELERRSLKDPDNESMTLEIDTIKTYLGELESQ